MVAGGSRLLYTSGDFKTERDSSGCLDSQTLLKEIAFLLLFTVREYKNILDYINFIPVSNVYDDPISL